MSDESKEVVSDKYWYLSMLGISLEFQGKNLSRLNFLVISHSQDNSALVYQSKKGLVIITGYSHACHCTDLHSKIALSRVANVSEVGVGLSIQYDEKC